MPTRTPRSSSQNGTASRSSPIVRQLAAIALLEAAASEHERVVVLVGELLVAADASRDPHVGAVAPLGHRDGVGQGPLRGGREQSPDPPAGPGASEQRDRDGDRDARPDRQDEGDHACAASTAREDPKEPSTRRGP